MAFCIIRWVSLDGCLTLGLVRNQGFWNVLFQMLIAFAHPVLHCPFLVATQRSFIEPSGVLTPGASIPLSMLCCCHSVVQNIATCVATLRPVLEQGKKMTVRASVVAISPATQVSNMIFTRILVTETHFEDEFL